MVKIILVKNDYWSMFYKKILFKSFYFKIFNSNVICQFFVIIYEWKLFHHNFEFTK